MKIEIATKQDVPALLDLQRKAFGPLCEELDCFLQLLNHGDSALATLPTLMETS